MIIFIVNILLAIMKYFSIILKIQEFNAIKVKADGKKSNVIVGIDGSNLYIEKEKVLTRSPGIFLILNHEKYRKNTICLN